MCEEQQGWILHCADCLGGLVYALSTPETATLLALGVEHALWPLAWIEEGAIDRVMEVEYCTCTEKE